MSVQRLVRRNSVYYFRCVILRRISAVLNRKEIRFSLKTASFGEAKRKLVCVNLLIEDYFIKIRQQININKYSSNFTMMEIMKFNTNKALALADEYASQTKGDKWLSSEEMLKSYLNKTETKEDADTMMALYHSEDISDELYYYKCLCDRYDYEVSAEKELKLAIESGLCKYEDLGKSILVQDLKKAHRRKIELKRTATEDEDYFDVMDVCAHSGKPKNPQKETCSKHYWEDVYKAFKSDPDNRGLSQSTMQERYLRLGTVFRLMDLKNVEDISVETVRNLRRKLMEYPVNCRKLYPKLSPEDAIRQGKAGANVRLFDCSKNGRGYFSDNFSKWFKRYKDKAGVRSNVNFHSFRHTFAVKACEANINDKLIDTLAGWSKGHTVGNISMQKRYINELSIKKAG